MILKEKDIKKLLEKIISGNRVKELELGLSSSETGSTRFANNAVNTNGVYNRLNLYAQVFKGKKKGIATASELCEEKIKEAIRRAERLAEVAPEDPERMPLLGHQTYPRIPPLYYKETAEFTPGERVDTILSVIKRARKERLEAAGFFESSAGASGYMNSQGLFYYFIYSRAYFSNTIRGEGGSGWASAEEEDVRRLRPEVLASRALKKARESRNARQVEPGKYTVVLEPAAVADLVWFLLYNFTAREADEGRNFLSRPNGGNKLGEKLFSSKVTVYSDPSFPENPAFPVGEDGLPRGKRVWVEKGVVKNLVYTRYWAEQKKREPISFPANLIMEGGRDSVEDLIKATKRGVLVTRLWYIRDLNPMLLLLTGLTRDGVFWIENGKVQYPIKNFRFNESPVGVLDNVEAMSKPVRTVGGETGQTAFVPALKVKEFNFSSLSDAI